ncbi:hypothetical protein CSV71_03860 [Sporosarcina sp. P21c]|uniref:hypothetical protein n=1 Tax=Sporosarcina TaxID=1569 RepID=UPI000A15923C|nr:MULTISPECIES: hypothetical protein [Sporosarcina]ARJ37841.1 hypothetical protein SporoP8_02415 [Sporosarcina ureae]PIC67854.1 hypothetical protein CSV78_05950 [Sporosarcina sp. P16a]PIC90713.1 hypothetical protein CSV71_03860 [Sporosarcina sp. P21c]PIC93478.1 hypothetical protein CSV70_05815 [Sporosarcina sp. P25]
MKRIIWIAVNLLSGVFVIINSVVGFGISGMGEGSTNNFMILGLAAIWAIGLVLQLKKKGRAIGLLITFIPVMFIVYIYLKASMM